MSYLDSISRSRVGFSGKEDSNLVKKESFRKDIKSTGKKRKIIWSMKKKSDENENENEDMEMDGSMEERVDSSKSLKSLMRLHLEVPLAVIPAALGLYSPSYFYFILYQCGLVPLPFPQFQQIVEDENNDDDAPDLTFKRLQKRKKQFTFVSQMSKSISALEDFFEYLSNSIYSSNVLLAMGIGPSVNNLKKVFFLQFHGLPNRSNDLLSNDHKLNDQMKNKVIEKLKRQFIQQLIQFQSDNDNSFSLASSTSLTSSIKNGNIFFFLQINPFILEEYSKLFPDKSIELMEMFSFFHKSPFPSDYLSSDSQKKPSFSAHRQRQIQKRIFHLKIHINENNQEEEKEINICNDQRDQLSMGWLVSKNGIKVLKSF